MRDTLHVSGADSAVAPARSTCGGLRQHDAAGAARSAAEASGFGQRGHPAQAAASELRSGGERSTASAAVAAPAQPEQQRRASSAELDVSMASGSSRGDADEASPSPRNAVLDDFDPSAEAGPSGRAVASPQRSPGALKRQRESPLEEAHVDEGSGAPEAEWEWGELSGSPSTDSEEREARRAARKARKRERRRRRRLEEQGGGAE